MLRDELRVLDSIAAWQIGERRRASARLASFGCFFVISNKRFESPRKHYSEFQGQIVGVVDTHHAVTARWAVDVRCSTSQQTRL